jgi:hypothetical protein
MLTRHGDVRPFSDPLGPFSDPLGPFSDPLGPFSDPTRRGALSNDVHMSPPKKSEPPNGQGVLSNLPRTRPQRASARRAAARQASTAPTVAHAVAASSNGGPAPKPVGAPAPTAPSTKRGPAPAREPAPAKRARGSAKPKAVKPDPGPPVPRQGFECEGERASGPVHPPGGTELVASAAEMIGELAKAGLSTGERLFKDVLSRLPLS